MPPYDMRISDWSSDVCSSGRRGVALPTPPPRPTAVLPGAWSPRRCGPPVAMALKKNKKGRKAISPLLEKILSDRSNVVFNVPKKVKQTERQFFDNARLNKAIIFKYPNFDMEISEFVSSSGMKKERPVETCMY